MKKEVLLPVLAAAGGLAGFALRTWQLSDAADPQSGILRLTHPATLALILLTALTALVLLVLSRTAVCPENLPNLFTCPSALYMTVTAASGFLLLLAGGLGLAQAFFQDPQADALSDTGLVLPAVELLCGVLCFPAGVSVLVFGKHNYRGTDSARSPLSTLAPGYLALLLLIRHYVGHSNDPLLLRYAWSLLGWICTLLALYLIAGCCYRRPAPRRLLFFCGAAVYLQLLSLADRPAFPQSAAGIALVLYLLAQYAALARNTLGSPRMPFGAQGDEEQAEHDKIDE